MSLPTSLDERVEDAEFEVSAVMPCLNEADSLPYCIESIKRAFVSGGIRGEIIVADNSSTDLLNARIGEIPVTLHPDRRISQPSHLRTYRDGRRTVHLVVPGTSLVALSFQTAFSSFFVSMLGIGRK